VRLVANTSQPDADELREIGRRLCKLLPVEPEEPICSTSLRLACHDPNCVGKPHMVYALTACGDALAALELPAEVQEAREALDEYVSLSRGGGEVRARLIDRLMKAKPFLDEEAERRARVRYQAVTDEEPEQGLVGEIWPSPESLTTFPTQLLDAIGREMYFAAWLQKVMHDLSHVGANVRLATRLSPIKMSLAKALARAGYDVPTIATVTEPLARPGRERRQACNSVRRRLESTTEDLVFVPRSDPRPTNAEMLATELERAERFVAGVGTDVRCVITDLQRDESAQPVAPASSEPSSEG
jgi:hypothetical protein